MKYTSVAVVCLLSCVLSLTNISSVCAEDLPMSMRNEACIQKGLKWLTKQQYADGHWEMPSGQHPVAMTALSGMSFLMEGSTARDGKYAKNIKRAAKWLATHGMSDGNLVNPNIPNESVQYMYDHGYALLFLSCVYGEEDEIELRHSLNDVLARAVLFTGKAQNRFGGWSYTSAADGGEGGDSSSTVVQMQSLRSARNAGIVVPKEIIDKGIAYLKQITNNDGGVSYGWDSKGRSQPGLTVAALACACSAGEYESDFVRKWLKYCQQNIPLTNETRNSHYMNYYLAQVMYGLGENRYTKLFPDSSLEMQWTWNNYRKMMFDSIVRSQVPNGNWDSPGNGSVYATAVNLAILQLDNGALPIYQR